MDPDEDLVWPDPERAEAWWVSHRRRFREGERHLVGRPIEESSLQQLLRDGSQRRRADAALELKRLHPDRPLFEVRAPAKRQQLSLGLA
jgi:uncharacterized protein (TIGR02270 family)